MRSAIGILIVLLSVLAATPRAGAQERAVQLEVWVIRATTRDAQVSPDLREVAEKLKKQFKYTGFKLERKIPGRADAGRPFSAELAGGYRTTITPVEREARTLKVRVEVTRREGQRERSVLATTVSAPAGELVLFGCGGLDGGDYLIMAARAR